MPNATAILLKLDDAGYEVAATITATGTIVEAVHRQTGERFTVMAEDGYAAAVELAGMVGVE